MSNYTPTTNEVRESYVFYNLSELEAEVLRAEFDRWLAAHDAEVRAEVFANMDKWISASIDARKGKDNAK